MRPYDRKPPSRLGGKYSCGKEKRGRWKWSHDAFDGGVLEQDRWGRRVAKKRAIHEMLKELAG